VLRSTPNRPLRKITWSISPRPLCAAAVPASAGPVSGQVWAQSPRTTVPAVCCEKDCDVLTRGQARFARTLECAARSECPLASGRRCSWGERLVIAFRGGGDCDAGHGVLLTVTKLPATRVGQQGRGCTVLPLTGTVVRLASMFVSNQCGPTQSCMWASFWSPNPARA